VFLSNLHLTVPNRSNSYFIISATMSKLTIAKVGYFFINLLAFFITTNHIFACQSKHVNGSDHALLFFLSHACAASFLRLYLFNFVACPTSLSSLQAYPYVSNLQSIWLLRIFLRNNIRTRAVRRFSCFCHPPHRTTTRAAPPGSSVLYCLYIHHVRDKYY
jgi:hypothetical protein